MANALAVLPSLDSGVAPTVVLYGGAKTEPWAFDFLAPLIDARRDASARAPGRNAPFQPRRRWPGAQLHVLTPLQTVGRDWWALPDPREVAVGRGQRGKYFFC